MPFYFAALYAAMEGWWGRTVRDRSSRFRIRTVFWTGLASAALIPFWPFDRQVEIPIALMIATTVQLVSPWDAAASAYAQYVRATKKKQKARPRQQVA